MARRLRNTDDTDFALLGTEVVCTQTDFPEAGISRATLSAPWPPPFGPDPEDVRRLAVKLFSMEGNDPLGWMTLPYASKVEYEEDAAEILEFLL